MSQQTKEEKNSIDLPVKNEEGEMAMIANNATLNSTDTLFKKSQPNFKLQNHE